MKTTYHGENNDIAYEECRSFSEMKDLINGWSICDDDFHIRIVYKDGTVYDSTETPVMPKTRGVYSCVVSGSWGYTFYNAVPDIHVDEYECELCYCYCKGMAW